MELFIGHPTQQQQYTFKTGVRVIIHNQTIEPLPEEDGINVATGQQTDIAISRSFINKLQRPFSQCQMSNLNTSTKSMFELVNEMSNSFNITVYVQKFCMKLCFHHYVFTKCNCVDPAFLMYRKLMIKVESNFVCLNSSQSQCVQDADVEFYSKNIIDECIAKCPIECNKIFYKPTVSIANYPTEWYTDQLHKSKSFKQVLYHNKLNPNKMLSFSELQQSILMLDVHYDDLMYESVDETPAITLESLISYIGGTLGLFIGISLLSICELVELIVYMTYLSILKIWTKNIIKN
jgi:hypothetical protein